MSDKYLWIPGTAGSWPYAPDLAAYDPSDELDLRVRTHLDSAKPTAQYAFVYRFTSNTGWYFAHQTGGSLVFVWGNGTSAEIATSTAFAPDWGTDPRWFRVTVDFNNGSGNYEVDFYYSNDQTNDPDSPTWTKIGSTVSAAEHVLANAAYTLVMGDTSTDAQQVYRVWAADTIDGSTPFIDANFAELTVAEVEAGEFTESSPNAATVTLDGDEWAYVQPHTGGILGRAEALYLASNGYSKGSPKWPDLSGNDHHAQWGSAAGSDTNDPLFLGYEGEKYLWLPKTGVDDVSTPSTASLQVTGDIDLRILCRTDWSNQTRGVMVNKYLSNGYFFDLFDDTRLIFGTTGSDYAVSTAHGLTDDEWYWLRVTRVQTSGATTFYKSTDGETWDTISSHTVDAGTAIGSNALELQVGGRGSGTSTFTGSIKRAQVYDGIDTNLVFDMVMSDTEEPFATFTERALGATCTINRGTSGKVATVVDRDMFLLGTDDYFVIPDDGSFDFDQGEDFTILMALRPNIIADANDYFLLSQATGWSAGEGIKFIISGFSNPDKYQFRTIDDAAQSTTSIDDETAVAQEFVVVGARRDTTGDTLDFARDGTITKEEPDITTGDIDAGVDLYVGATSGGLWTYDGALCALIVWREALTDDEIAQLQTELLGGANTLLLMGVG